MIRIDLTALEAAGVMSALVADADQYRRIGNEPMQHVCERVARKIRDALHATRQIEDAQCEPEI